MESLIDLAGAVKDAWGSNTYNITTVTITNPTSKLQRSEELEMLVVHPESNEVVSAYIPVIDIPSNTSIIHEVEYKGLPYGKNVISLKTLEGTASRMLKDIVVMKDSDLASAKAQYRERLATLDSFEKGSASKLLEELMSEQ